jgi:Zn-dependent protease with chaperone function
VAWVVVVLGAPGVLLAVLAGVWLAVTWSLAVTALWAAAVAVWIRAQDRLCLRRHAARRLGSGDAPRLVNLARGLSSEIGVRPPALYVLAGSGNNALVCRAQGGVLAVSNSLMDSYTRTELEAVVAHCLLRLEGPGLKRAALAAALGPAAGPVAASWDAALDDRAAALTRYPPALAAAVHKADARGGRFRGYWFSAEGGQHPSTERRVQALLDL